MTQPEEFELVHFDRTGDLAPLAALLGRPVDVLRDEMAGFPVDVRGIGLLHRGRTIAGGFLVERDGDRPGRRSLVRVTVPDDAPAGADMELVRHVEHACMAAGAMTLRVSIAAAPGLGAKLVGRGYTQVESYLRLRLAGPARSLPLLPTGFTELELKVTGVARFLEMSNAAFAGVPGTLPLGPEDWAKIRQSPHYREDAVRILADAHGLVGFLRGAVRPGELPCEVEAIGLLPRARGRGLGRWLLRRCEELLRAHGARTIELMVASSNRSALGLYLAEGYEEIFRRDTWECSLPAPRDV